MRNLIPDVLLVNGINGASIAALTLNDVKDGVAITLGLVSIVSTVLIIRESLRKARDRKLTTKGTKNTKVLANRIAKSGRRRLRFDVKKILWLAALLVLSGCTHFRGKQERVEGKVDANRAALEEESRALTTAVVDVLSRAETNCFAAQVALELAKQDQVIEGVPTERILSAELLADKSRASEELREREQYQRRLLRERVDLTERLRAAEARLIEFGRRYEAEQNGNVVKRFWRWLVGTSGIGGIVALCVFCPAAIPLIGRMAAWVVGKIPSLAGYAGVVSKDAFDAVVKGVGEFRRAHDETAEKKRLDGELLKATDREHRGLIERRRQVLGV